MSAPSNAERAYWADEALKAFIARTGTDCEDSLPDLLRHLMYWADRAGLSFAEAMYAARHYYGYDMAMDGES